MKSLSASEPQRLKKYPAYKDSGVEWLGKVPSHWETWKITHGFQTIGSGTTPKSDSSEYYDGEIPWVTTSELRETEVTNTYKELSEAALDHYSTLKIYPSGSLLIAMYGATIGRLGILGIPATVNQACCVFSKPTKFDTKFTFYWLWMRRPILIALSSGGGQPNLSQDDLCQLRIPIPVVAEQQFIASFLDRKTAEIDALIAKKRRMIVLLQEKRTAVISHAVSKGLDPNAPMKDSGVEWLGKVPRHWEVIRLKFTLSQPLQYGANESSEGDDPTLPRFIRITDIDDSGRLRDDTFKSLPEDLAKPFLLEHGDLLLARSGATVGKTLLYDRHWGRAAFAGYLIRARFNKKVALPEFVHYFTRSSNYWDWLSSSFIQATIQNVSAEKYANIIVPIPMLNEQRSIVEFIDSETTKINALIGKINNAIDKLLEYRTALISAAVTGKIDVREEVRA